MRLGEKLRIARKQRGFTQAKLGERVGMSEQTIRRWEARDTIPDDVRDTLSEILGVRLSEVDSGDSVAEQSIIYPTGAQLQPLDVYNVGHVAGATDADGEPVDTILVAANDRAAVDRGLRIQGRSMVPLFMPGDIVGIKDQQDAQVGQVVLARADGELTFKTYREDATGRAILWPENEAEGYRPIIPKRIEIIGVYRWMKRVREDGRI